VRALASQAPRRACWPYPSRMIDLNDWHELCRYPHTSFDLEPSRP